MEGLMNKGRLLQTTSEENLLATEAWVKTTLKSGAVGVFRATAAALPLPPSLLDALRVPKGRRAIMADVSKAGLERGDWPGSGCSPLPDLR